MPITGDQQKAVKLIEEEAHVPGLTDRIKKFLEKATGKKIEMIEEPEPEESPTYEEVHNDGNSGYGNSED